ncbi:unnamed protein product [[Candida] boidinii]|uniref:Ceramide glucosyltransferase n=1 Tax=Candida boidinii TaxID=5477 RepID=A0A9W6WHW9_CANBO|nr:hypothetical protein B5S33_g2071 [[Candida] boidinii]GME73455.1 unnamed protein product [[Candida] boidinii]
MSLQYENIDTKFNRYSVIPSNSQSQSSSLKTESSITNTNEFSMFIKLFAVIFFIWYIVVLSLAYNGFFEIMFKFTNKTKNKILNSIRIGNNDEDELLVDDDQLEGVTILRPLKGVDPEMEICLRSCLEQDYPLNKLEILFCVQDNNDSSINLVRRLLNDYKHVNAKLLIDDDPNNKYYYGPNPKVNNLAKGYERASNDILWILDSNVWCRKDTLKRSVISLTKSLDNGNPTYNFDTKKGKQVKLVHHVPLAISLNEKASSYKYLGTKLDEMFLSTSHSKFYVSFNRLSVAPCVNGKSNLYRRSELDNAVRKMGENYEPSNNGQSGDTYRDAAYYSQSNYQGLRFFARYIGEDNMIAIALWNYGKGRTGMTGDCVVQPLGNTRSSSSIISYCNRRIRWLRVRRYMVLMATLLEPTTECLLCGFYGTFGISVLFLSSTFNRTYFVIHVLIWYLTDYIQSYKLFNSIKDINSPSVSSSLSSENLNSFSDTAIPTTLTTITIPYFLNDSFITDFRIGKYKLKSFRKFSPIWLLREILALPIWIIAILGSKINWRGQYFIIKSDLSAERLRNQ